MEKSERFWNEAKEIQSINDQRFDSIEKVQKRLERDLGDLLSHMEKREKGKSPMTVETHIVLAVEVTFDDPGKVKYVFATCS